MPMRLVGRLGRNRRAKLVRKSPEADPRPPCSITLHSANWITLNMSGPSPEPDFVDNARYFREVP